MKCGLFLTLSFLAPLQALVAQDCGQAIVAGGQFESSRDLREAQIPDGYWLWVVGTVGQTTAFSVVSDALFHDYLFREAKQVHGPDFVPIAAGELFVNQGEVAGLSNESETMRETLRSRGSSNPREANDPSLALDFLQSKLHLKVAQGFSVRRIEKDQLLGVHLNPVYNQIAELMGGSINVRHNLIPMWGFVDACVEMALNFYGGTLCMEPDNGLVADGFTEVKLFLQFLVAEGVIAGDSASQEVVAELEAFAHDSRQNPIPAWEAQRLSRLQEVGSSVWARWLAVKNFDHPPFNLQQAPRHYIGPSPAADSAQSLIR